MVDTASTVVAEDLTQQFVGHDHGPNMNRRLAAWLHADVNAAINVLERFGDPDITLFTPHTRVKQILKERADRLRTRLPVQDSSARKGAESEPSDHAYAQV